MITEDQKLTYAGIYLLKLLDLSPKDGGLEIPVVLPHEMDALEPALDRLLMDGMIEIDRKKGRYRLTQRGTDYVGMLIDEIEALITELDERPAPEVVRIIRQRNLDPMRVRFLWAWYQGEIDDLVTFQQRRGVDEVERDWGSYLLADEFYEELARDLEE